MNSDEVSATYPHAGWVSREYGGVPVGNLVEIFQLEREFHRRILETASAEDRKRQYHELYERVHILKQRDTNELLEEGGFDRLVLTFRRELANKSILDVGCGNGMFLTTVAKLLPHGELWGLDTSSINTKDTEQPFRFLQEDVTSFTVPRQFDAVFSHQVFEHIAPADSVTHLRSIHSALLPNGTFIVCLPNRHWGPQDITRIVDNTFRGRIPAQGSHLNESSYTEMVPMLEANGFRNVRTVAPLGAFIPWARAIRVKPWINRILERSATLRSFSNLVAKNNRPIFKNPIMLVCERAD
jgi:2-polyprenyl-3-methyl-5-hydroxy-6-metoxy-1,4-benzoquinol methylase